MRRKVLLIVGVVALIAAMAVGITATSAYGHNQDNNSLFGCAATRPSSNYSIDHSWWDGLFPDLVVGRCMAHDIYTGNQTCWRLSWFHPGQPDQYFQGTGYDYQPPCWFSEP